jgi:PAS domain S-box-containing protein
VGGIFERFLPRNEPTRERGLSRAFAVTCFGLVLVATIFIVGAPTVDADVWVNIALGVLFVSGPLVMRWSGSRTLGVAIVFSGFSLFLTYFACATEGLGTGIGGWFVLLVVAASFLGGARVAVGLGAWVTFLTFVIGYLESAGAVPLHPLDTASKVTLTNVSVWSATAVCAVLAALYARARANAEAEVDRALADLGEERGRLAAVVESTDAVLMTVDADGAIDAFNAQADDLLAGIDRSSVTIFDLADTDGWRSACATVLAGRPLRFDQSLEIRGELRTFDFSFSPRTRELGATTVTVIATDVTERARRARENAELAAAIAAANEMIAVSGFDFRISYVNPAFERMTGAGQRDAFGRDALGYCSTGGDSLRSEIAARLREGKPWSGRLQCERANAGTVEVEQTVTPILDASGIAMGAVWVGRDVTERRLAEAREAELTRQLIDASRRAGMAQVATGVLHNVGNVLNSVNVSATCAADRVRTMRVDGLAKSAGLLRSQPGEVPTEGTLADYLERLAESLVEDRRTILEEMAALAKNIDHIKVIIARQQTFARSPGGIVEAVSPVELIEDAIGIHAGSFEKHGIEVVRRFESLSPVRLQRHGIVEILVNLLSNARHALLDGPATEPKRLVVSVSRRGEIIRFEVTDNGIGIPQENLTRIFAHGFSTKKDGHGFGLHTCAIGAKEMGGTLAAGSQGPGTGATFHLDVPVRAAGRDEGFDESSSSASSGTSSSTETREGPSFH